MAAVHAADYEVAIRWLLKSRETNRAYDATAFFGWRWLRRMNVFVTGTRAPAARRLIRN
jgi:hypothetical protein